MRFGLLLALSLIGCTYATDPIGETRAAEEVPTACWVAGSGAIQPGPGETDLFTGEARQTSGTRASGTWIHRASSGEALVGLVNVLDCRANGGYGPGGPPGSTANLSDFSGTGRWNGRSGYTFRVHAEDRGGAGADVGYDYYSIDIFDRAGVNVYFAAGTLTAGNYEIYPIDYVLPEAEDECDDDGHGHHGHGRGHCEHGRGHGYGHDRHGCDCRCDDD
jgi:hypothetical protein